MPVCYLSHIGIIDTDTEKFPLHEQPATDMVRSRVLEYPKIGVDASQHLCGLSEVQQGNLHLHSLQGLSGNIRPVRSDVRTQELYSPVYLAHGKLAHMQVQSQFAFEEILYLRNKAQEPFLVVRDYQPVVHVPAVVPAFQYTLHELVEGIHIDIRE